MLVGLFVSDFKINHTFSHSDHDVFYKISQLVWKEDRYESAIKIIGSFQILLVKLKLFEKYDLFGLR